MTSEAGISPLSPLAQVPALSQVKPLFATLRVVAQAAFEAGVAGVAGVTVAGNPMFVAFENQSVLKRKAVENGQRGPTMGTEITYLPNIAEPSNCKEWTR